jgi:hypothetical protein
VKGKLDIIISQSREESRGTVRTDDDNVFGYMSDVIDALNSIHSPKQILYIDDTRVSARPAKERGIEPIELHTQHISSKHWMLPFPVHLKGITVFNNKVDKTEIGGKICLDLPRCLCPRRFWRYFVLLFHFCDGLPKSGCCLLTRFMLSAFVFRRAGSTIS